MKIKVIPALLILLPAFVFSAAPSKINYQGRLLDSSGVPIESGQKVVNFGFFSDEAAIQNLNSPPSIDTEYTVTPVKGFFSIAVDVKPEWFVGGDVYMQVSVEGVPLGSPQLLVSSPYALSVSEGSIGVKELKNESVNRAKMDSNALLKVYKTADGRLVLGQDIGSGVWGYYSSVCRNETSRYMECNGNCLGGSARANPAPCPLTDVEWIGSLLLKP